MNSKLAYEYEEELEANYKDTSFISVLSVVIEIIRNLDEMIYRLDENGNIIYNKKGKPRINWINVIKNLAKIIGSLIVMRKKTIW
jgi:hypothetical protein|tara:strand:+ start:10349 stop:10603 length:255 start_codon:yes stop_codon:yes gene_type:complete